MKGVGRIDLLQVGFAGSQDTCQQIVEIMGQAGSQISQRFFPGALEQSLLRNCLPGQVKPESVKTLQLSFRVVECATPFGNARHSSVALNPVGVSDFLAGLDRALNLLSDRLGVVRVDDGPEIPCGLS